MRKLCDREGAQACRVVEQAAEDDDGGDDVGGDDDGGDDDEVVMMSVRLLPPMMLRMTKLCLSQNCECLLWRSRGLCQ